MSEQPAPNTGEPIVTKAGSVAIEAENSEDSEREEQSLVRKRLKKRERAETEMTTHQNIDTKRGRRRL